MKRSLYSINDKKRIYDALDKARYIISDDSRDKYVEDFAETLKKDLHRKRQSLSILPTFIQFSPQVSNVENIAVIEVSTTNVTKGVLHRNDNSIKVQEVQSYPVPGLCKEESIDDFFKQIIRDARDVLRVADKVGICFRHPIKASEDKDGTLLSWARAGIDIPDLIGKKIGAAFEEYLYEEFEKEYDITVVNDVVATLFAGLSQSEQKEYEDYLGLVHGRGYNLSYIEDGKNLSSIIDKKFGKDQLVVNLQAGSYGEIDETAIDKSVSDLLGMTKVGVYSQKVNTHCFPLQLSAVVDFLYGKFFSEKFKKEFGKIPELDLEQIVSFARCGLKSSSKISAMFRHLSHIEASHFGGVVEHVFDRTARLVAIQLAGLIKYKDIGHNSIQPVAIIVDGDFFDIASGFEERVMCELHQYFKGEDKRFVKFLRIPHAALLGAGIAASF